MLLLVARFFVVMPFVAAIDSGVDTAWTLLILAAAFGLLVHAFWINSTELAELRRVGNLDERESTPPAGSVSRCKPKMMREARLVQRVVVPVVVAAVLMVWVFLQINHLRDRFRASHPEVDGGDGSAWTSTTWWIVGSFTVLTGLVTIAVHSLTHRTHGGPDRARLGKAALFSGFLGGSLFSLLFVWILFATRNHEAWLGPAIAAFGPPLALLVIVVAFLAEVAVLGRAIGEAEREWWASLSAWLLMSAVAWSTFFGCVLFVPAS